MTQCPRCGKPSLFLWCSEADARREECILHDAGPRSWFYELKSHLDAHRLPRNAFPTT